MPIIINELNSEVIDQPAADIAPADGIPPDRASVASLPIEWQQYQCLMQERQARLRDD